MEPIQPETIWEEKNYIEPMRNSENSPTIGLNGIIIETKPYVIVKPCSDIGNEKQWLRNCPKCNAVIICSTKKYRNTANRLRTLCYACAFSGRPVSQKTRQKFREMYKGIPISDEHKQHIKSALRNMPPDKKEAMITKSSNSRRGLPSHNKGNPSPKAWRMNIRNGLLNMSPELKRKVIDGNKRRTMSDETRRKMRIARIQYIEKTRFGGKRMTPRFSLTACKYFDGLNKSSTWNLQHALNGGEHYVKDFGYWLDAYDKDKNIVVEYDEGYHNQRKDADRRRMTEIKNHLGCRFFRYDAVSGELKEY